MQFLINKGLSIHHGSSFSMLPAKLSMLRAKLLYANLYSPWLYRTLSAQQPSTLLFGTATDVANIFYQDMLTSNAS